jgi:cell division transport system permease protein
VKALRYAFREASASLWRRRGASLFAVAAIGLAMVVLGALLLVTSNIERMIAAWSTAAEFSVYLRDDATSEQRGRIEQIIDASGVATRREYVSKAQALSRFRGDFTDLASLATNLEENPFPASIEVQITPEASASGRVDTLVAELTRASGAADVRYDRQWISRLSGGLGALERVGGVLVIVMLAAAALTVATVVRLALHARRDEIEIMLLVGSPYAFIRGPFVAEGMLQGGVGALLALVALWLGFSAVQAGWGGSLAAMVGPGILRFLSLGTCAWLIAGGMLVGSLGGFAAARTTS